MAVMPTKRWRRVSKPSSPAAFSGSKSIEAATIKPQDPKAANGYVREDYTVALAQKAGFVRVGSSEINANPKDTKDWVDGVWTLPPTLIARRQGSRPLYRRRRSR
jgi:predicted methyltransferase